MGCPAAADAPEAHPGECRTPSMAILVAHPWRLLFYVACGDGPVCSILNTLVEFGLKFTEWYAFGLGLDSVAESR